MGKLKESIIVSSEYNDLIVDETIDYRMIVDSLIEGAVAFTMLSNHCPPDEKHYFLEKRNQLAKYATFLASKI